MLRTGHRLRRTSDFKAVYSRGRSYVHPLLVVYMLKREEGETRIGFSVSKKLGGAVSRNRIKRRLREACKALLPQISSGLDIVVVGRSAVVETSVEDMQTALKEQFRRAGVIVKS